jgi:hypothetical protein
LIPTVNAFGYDCTEGQFTVACAVLTANRVRDSSVRQVGSGRRAILPFYPEKFGSVEASSKGRKNLTNRTTIGLNENNIARYSSPLHF